MTARAALRPDHQRTLEYVQDYPGTTTSQIARALFPLRPTGYTRNILDALFAKRLVGRQGMMSRTLLSGGGYSWYPETTE